MWYTLAIAAITAPLCALAPAIRASRTDLMSALRRQRGESGSPTMRNALVAGQVALSFVLMTAAILFARATVTLASVNPGFDLEQHHQNGSDADGEAVSRRPVGNLSPAAAWNACGRFREWCRRRRRGLLR